MMTRRKRRHFFPLNFLKKTARFLNQGLKFCFLFFAFCFLSLNLHSSFFPENEGLAKARRRVLNSPFNPEVHANLAEIYLETGDLEKAERELFLANRLSVSTSSPGLERATISLNKAKERPEKICQEISFWEEVIKEKPDYRDAYFQLAILYYQINQKEETAKYLQKALELDPNFRPAKKLEKLLSGE